MKLIGLFLGLALATSGCATFFSNLPKIEAYVQDGELVIGTIETFANAYFMVHTNPDLQKKVNTAIARAKSALDAALRVATASGELDQAQIDAAFADFKGAYTDLINMLGPLGVSMSGSEMKATPGGLTVPMPLALTSKK